MRRSPTAARAVGAAVLPGIREGTETSWRRQDRRFLRSLCRIMAVLCLLLLARTAMADWAAMTRDDLRAASSLIVLGEFLGADAVVPAPPGPPMTLGVIAISRVVKGPASQRIALLRLPPPGAAGLVASDQVVFRPGQSGLWYLRSLTPGLYAADHPARFVPMDQAAPHLRALP